MMIQNVYLGEKISTQNNLILLNWFKIFDETWQKWSKIGLPLWLVKFHTMIDLESG